MYSSNPTVKRLAGVRISVKLGASTGRCWWHSLSFLMAVVVTLIGQRSRIAPAGKINTEASMVVNQVRLESQYPQATSGITATQKAHWSTARWLLASAPLCR